MIDKWQPILTAPKGDGEEILVTDGNFSAVVYWNEYPRGGGCWQGTYYDGYDLSYISGNEPTHWKWLHLEDLNDKT